MKENEQIIHQAEEIVERRNDSIIQRLIARFNGSGNIDEKSQIVEQVYAESDRQNTVGVLDEEEQINILFQRRKKRK